MVDDCSVHHFESVQDGDFLRVRAENREKIAYIVLKAFQQREVHNVQHAVEHWSYYLESHRNGGVHFRMAIKLTRPKRWLVFF